MSSRRRRSKGNQQDPFSRDESNKKEEVSPGNDLSGVSDLMYGEGDSGLAAQLRQAQSESRSMRVRFIPLKDIHPDPAQARRVMPASLRAEWLQYPGRVRKILLEWLDMAIQEAQQHGRPMIDYVLELQRDPEDSGIVAEEGDQLPEPGPVEASFRALLQLAASIHHHGLANPLTLVQEDERYLVETGERRFLAYNLLHFVSQEEDFIQGKWDTIPARVVDQKSIWRQAAENGARQDLNAISMARQLALLLMDIYRERGADFAEFYDMPGAEWYAQVYDARQFPVPYGRGAELAAAMGLKSANQLRQYRALLGLPERVWRIADEQNWTEYRLRKMLQDARQAARLSESDDESVTTVTVVDGYLERLAEYESGEITYESLPEALRTQPAPEPEPLPLPEHEPETVTTVTDSKPETNVVPRPRRVTLLSALAHILEVDTSTGTVTLQVETPEALEVLLDEGQIAITIHRPPEAE